MTKHSKEPQKVPPHVIERLRNHFEGVADKAAFQRKKRQGSSRRTGADGKPI